MNPNRRSLNVLESIRSRAGDLKVGVTEAGGATLFDFGIEADGGLLAGKYLAAVTCGDLAEVDITSQTIAGRNYASVCFSTDWPLLACIGCQYAGWPAQHGDFFAMASGPIRLLRGQEKVLEEFELTGSETSGVVCLETSRMPTADAIKGIATEANLDPSNLSIVVAPTRSLAGSIQVVARSVETALHKLHELGFDLRTVRSGRGTAPIPPIANDDVKGIGLTNDSILFGGEVDLWVDADPKTISEIGPEVPSSSSKDYGTPFYELFKQKEFNFYEIDPLLFSPACVRIHNLKSGNSQTFGELNPELLQKSFGS